MRSTSQTGFTLIEAVVILIALGITATMVTPMVTDLVRGPESARKLEAASLAQHQCAERVLAARNAIGFTLVATNLSLATNYCTDLAAVDGVSASVAIADKSGGACRTGFSCKEVTIGAFDNTSRTSIRINPLTLILVKY